ncbi:hypothetical protein F4553_000091 [Allocatelliglobosispora scoriae]|uniref:Uncharacterized protein n=1 Tax=Allocatelliglobosispora scoriae TaxID=643052 RepID=A0A841BIW0_9ACTN|nr:hypothetical protein [Allocatelliglobosispora scoriae]MBB5866712.1 hypothetical protein [Allocatelliglobosispora scoriae]
MTGAGAYSLAGLLRCPGDDPMLPVVRVYRRYQCPTCAVEVDAEFAESTVWEQVRRLRPVLVPEDVPQEQRGDVMRGVARAVVFVAASMTFRTLWLAHPAPTAVGTDSGAR